MKIAIKFAPWIVFTIVGIWSWRVGAAAALATLLVAVATSRPVRLGVLNIAMLTFFAFATVLAVATPHTGLADWLHPLSAGWLALVTLASIAADRPFTMDFARESVPAEVAASPEFLAVNKEISLRWAGAFAAIAAGAAYGVVAGRPIVGTAVAVVALFWVFKFTQRAASAAHAAS